MTIPNTPKSSFALFPLLGASALALLGACDSETRTPYCEDTVTILDSLDDETPAGVKPADILRVIQGERALELSYIDAPPDGVEVSINPAATGTTGMTLALEHAGGQVRWIDSEEALPPGNGPSASIAIECPNRIEIDAELSLTTDDGVFAELFAVTVTASVDYDDQINRAEVSYAFEPDALDGSFMVTAISPEDPKRVDYGLDVVYPLTVTEDDPNGDAIGQPNGVIGGGAEYESGSGDDGVATWARFDLATFGDWSLYN